VAVYALNSDVNRFEPVAYTDEFATLCSGPPSVAVGDDDSVLWNAYVTETGTVVDDPASFDRSRIFGPAVESGSSFRSAITGSLRSRRATERSTPTLDG